jgi:two-component system sensor histidine kinase NreB
MISINRKHGRLLDAPASLVELGPLGAEPAVRPASIFTTRTDDSAAAVRRRTGRSGWERLRGRARQRRRWAMEDVLAAERRRMAADVHDLIMQDLAFALATARTLTDQPALATQASAVVEAGERALEGARGLIGRLAEQDRRPVIEAVGESVRVASRRTPVSFDAGTIAAHEQPDQPTLMTLVHIGREAVTNAIKHADPAAIEVVLEHADEWRLKIRDDGRGFDTAAADRGFGLQSMRRHAQNLGGSFCVTSEVGAGTTVEVTLP